MVGIDIGSEKHYARAFTNRAIEVSRKPFSFANSGAGYQRFGEWVEGLREAAGKARVMVGLEPTGHYWFTLADDLRQRGYELVLVAPQHVKHSKEMDDNTQRKDDRKDPGVIAKLVTEGRYDALNAHVSLVFVRYMLLSLQKRFNEDDRTIGELFLLMVDELADTTFAHAMQLIVDVMLQTVQEHFGLSDDQLLTFTRQFYDRLPACYQRFLQTPLAA